jgi:hypothetical protein
MLTMRLNIEQRQNEGIIILDLKGPLTLGHGDLELVTGCRHFISTGRSISY